MANSIDGWFADRADGSDGPGDGEHVESQAIWDLHRTTAPLGRPTSPKRSKKSKKTKSGRAANKAAGLNPEIVKLKPVILAARQRHPGVSYQFLVDRLRSEGVWVSRKDVAAVLDGSKASTGRTAPKSSSKKQPIVAATPLGPPPTPRAVSARRSKAVPAKRSSGGRLSAGSQAAIQRARRELELQRHAELERLARLRHAEPVKLPHVRLSLDEPRRRPVKSVGWRRATAAEISAPPAALPDEVPVPCYACGKVPTRFGSCNCT